MSDRDQLAGIAQERILEYRFSSVTLEVAYAVADAIIAAGWRAPARPLTDPEMVAVNAYRLEILERDQKLIRRLLRGPDDKIANSNADPDDNNAGQ